MVEGGEFKPVRITWNFKLIKEMVKSFLILLMLTTICVVCQAQTDSIRVVKLIMNDYEALGKFDETQHTLNCTKDYLLIENGEVWPLKKELEYFRSNKARTITRRNQFEFKSVKVENNFAYMVYDIKSTIDENNEQKKYHWVESAVFKKVKNEWKIALIHSTRLEN